MAKIFRAALVWALFLCACAPILPSTEALPQDTPPTVQVPTLMSDPPGTFPDSPALPIPKLSRTLETPHIDQPPDGPATQVPSRPQECAYQWAYQDLPELSGSLQQSIQALQPGAQAVAFAFGENCVHPDGSMTFLPMETDFNIKLQAGDGTEDAALGEWIVKVMQVIDSIPPGQLSGPRPGRVSIIFEANGEQSGVNFYTNQYHDLEPGLGYAEIYRALQASQ